VEEKEPMPRSFREKKEEMKKKGKRSGDIGLFIGEGGGGSVERGF